MTCRTNRVVMLEKSECSLGSLAGLSIFIIIIFVLHQNFDLHILVEVLIYSLFGG